MNYILLIILFCFFLCISVGRTNTQFFSIISGFDRRDGNSKG